MGVKRKIKRIVALCLWTLAGTGVIVLLVAAANKRADQFCRGYDIDINGQDEGTWFIDKKDIVMVLTSNGTVKIRDKKISSFDLNKLERRLEKEIWIRDAEIFFDNNAVLKVKVVEREPVARIFTVTGESFYIDSSGRRLPLSDKMSARLPVFTSFPGDGRKIRTAADKKLLNQVKALSSFLLEDEFWMAQVSQIDITPAREFEIVPTVGSHVVELGDGTELKKKFHRLLVFYRQVLAKAGMDKYERIKVQYDRQVVGIRKKSNRKTTTLNSIIP